MIRSPVTTKTQAGQFSLFETDPAPVAGLKYQADLLSPDEEARLVEHFAYLPFKAFDFHGHLGKRRIVSFGSHYDFSKQKLASAENIPAFLLPIREQAAELAGRKIGSTWQRKSFSAESRSAYLLRGPVRTEWEHSIAPLASLRYSITFRKLR
jgi:hypothetical protein